MKKIVFANDVFAFEEWLSSQNWHIDNIEKYDFLKSKNEFELLIESLISFDIFNSNKIIIINNINQIISKIDNNQLELIINNDSNDKIIIFYFSENIDIKSKWYKKLSNNVEVVDLNKQNNDFNSQIISFCSENNIKIDNRALNYFANNIKDYNHLNQVKSKLVLYEQSIDLDLAKLCLDDTSEINFLDLSQYIIDSNIDKILSSINYFNKNKQDYYGVIYLIAKKINTLFQVLLLQKAGFNQKDICMKLNISDKYYWFLANKMVLNFNLNKCKKWIMLIKEVDFLVKIGSLDKKFAFEKLMLGLDIYGKS